MVRLSLRVVCMSVWSYCIVAKHLNELKLQLFGVTVTAKDGYIQC